MVAKHFLVFRVPRPTRFPAFYPDDRTAYRKVVSQRGLSRHRCDWFLHGLFRENSFEIFCKIRESANGF
jgi:hypothetical protein